MEPNLLSALEEPSKPLGKQEIHIALRSQHLVLPNKEIYMKQDTHSASVWVPRAAECFYINYAKTPLTLDSPYPYLTTMLLACIGFGAAEEWMSYCEAVRYAYASI